MSNSAWLIRVFDVCVCVCVRVPSAWWAHARGFLKRALLKCVFKTAVRDPSDDRVCVLVLVRVRPSRSHSQFVRFVICVCCVRAFPWWIDSFTPTRASNFPQRNASTSKHTRTKWNVYILHRTTCQFYTGPIKPHGMIDWFHNTRAHAEKVLSQHATHMRECSRAHK